MGGPPCCDKSNVKKGLWTAEEDAKILAYVSSHEIGNWTLVPKKAGLNRCGESCRLRWTNYLRPDLKHDEFTPREEDLIIELHQAIGSRWSLIASQLPGRTDNDVENYWNTKLRKKLQEMGIDAITHKPFSQVLNDFENRTITMGAPPCCDKSNVKKGLWTAEEDAKILAYVSSHEIGNWTLVPKKAGLNRCGESCRLRWTNYLRPDLKHDGFTPQEEDLIIELHQAIGSRWSLIASQLPGRTDNDVENYWNTKLRKKLQEMGIDAITHKPFSQVLTDFGNVSSLPHAVNRIRSLNNINNTQLMPKPPIRSMYPNLYNNNTMQPLAHFFCHDVTSSTCSSSASSTLSSPPPHLLWQQQLPSYHQVQPTTSSDPFSWSKFFLCDHLFSMELQQAQNKQNMQRLPAVTNNNYPSFTQNHEGMHNNYGKHGEASCSSTSSFMDAILDRDSEIRSQFPNLAGACFDY